MTTFLMVASYKPAEGDTASAVDKDMLIDSEIVAAAGEGHRTGSGYDLIEWVREIDFEYPDEETAFKAQLRIIDLASSRKVGISTRVVEVADDAG